MEDHSLSQPVHVTVQMATVGMTVKVRTLHWVQQVMEIICSEFIW